MTVEGNGDVAVTIGLGGAGLNHVGVEDALFLHTEVLFPRDGMITVIGSSKETYLLFLGLLGQLRMAKVH